MRSHLLEGTVRHRRVRPFDYGLAHRVYYLALDVDELDEVARRLRLLSRNGRNLHAFHDADHLDPPARDVAGEVREHLAREGHAAQDWRITLVTSPRVLGYVFNPASFFLCHDEQGALRVVVVEVHNTHLERHLYTLVSAQPDAGAGFASSMAKAFYVSPFIELDGGYKVRVRGTPERLRITIDQLDANGGLLYTSLHLRRRRLTDRALASMALRHPLATHRTVGLIHWHALQLWRRGATFHRHGAVGR